MAVSDSTDWLSTPLSAISPLDAALRCQVCKDFFTTPMITSCSHTFCSLCIRRYLSQEGRCPVCRELDQEMKLRRNWAVEELVTVFSQSREGLLTFARTAKEKVHEPDVPVGPPKKRRKLNGEAVAQVERRNTRSQSRKAIQASQESLGNSTLESVPDSEDGSEYEEEETSNRESPHMPEPNDGLVACPACGKRMKEELVYTHLDTCTGSSSEPTPSIPSIPQSRAGPIPSGSIAYSMPNSDHFKDRLPTINYAMLSETQLRKKLKELGIPNVGNKVLLQKRHTEWLNLWNSNCDSRNPRPKRDLLRDLDTWERTQGRQIANNPGPSGVMIKDFDRDHYVRSHKSDFDSLIAQARAKANKAKAATRAHSLANSSEPVPPADRSGELNVPTPPPPATVEEIFQGAQSQTPRQNINGTPDVQDASRPEHVVPESPPNLHALVDLTSSKATPASSTPSQGSMVNVQ